MGTDRAAGASSRAGSPTADGSAAAGYARISLDRTGEAVGVERQTADIRKLAEGRGLELTAVYSDNDISALSGAERPGYQQLLSAVRSGEVATVIAFQSSRLWRNRQERAEAIDLFGRHRVKLLAVKGVEIDFSTAYGRAIMGMLGEIDTAESEIKGERVSAASAAAARAGKWRGGFRPFGFTQDGLSLVPEEAELIRDAYTAILQGQSLGSIVREWNSRGVTTTRGNAWSHPALRFLLKNPRNAGLSEYRGEVVGPGNWPAIVPEVTWQAVCAILRNPARRKSQDTRVRWMLSGLAVCSKCGGAVHSSGVQTVGGKTRTLYRCDTRKAGHAYQPAEETDKTLTDSTLLWLHFTPVHEALRRLAAGPAVDTAELTARVSAERALLADLADAFGNGELSRAEHLRQREKVTARLEAAEEALRKATGDGLLLDVSEWQGAGIEAGWDGLDLERRRALLRRVNERIILYPAGSPIGWRAVPNPDLPAQATEIATALS